MEKRRRVTSKNGYGCASVRFGGDVTRPRTCISLTGQVRRDGRKWWQVRRPNLGLGGELDSSSASIKVQDRRGSDTVQLLFASRQLQSLQQTFPVIIMKFTIALALCLVAVATAAPYVPVVPVVPVVPAVVHHPASVVHSSTVVQSHPSPVARVVAVPAIAHPVAVHPAVSVHPVAVHPVLPVHSVVHY
ncbi:A-kinase anchor protein 14-like [Aphis craccivora]|uniref:A-kinase anchor protein 14-like n=1 Tax=Aphis craccivora TaxID=307492 RepID=A0A6G0ZK66_APHCR|nr:A-kinase anchor protein 14-like [Aphis craccivora]